jgi:hypothetical protein
MVKWFERAPESPSTSVALLGWGDTMIFFLSTVLTILTLFIVHGKESHRMKRALETEQKEQSKELRNAIRVAPPPYFTKMLADVSDQAEDFLSNVFEESANMELMMADDRVTLEDKIKCVEETLESQRASIRAVLTGFGRLARTYDSVNPMDKELGIEYRANLMLNLEKSSEALEILFPEGLPEERFAVPFGAEASYLLVIDRRLSVKIGPQNKDLFIAAPDQNGGSEIIKPNKFSADQKVKNALLPVYWSESDDTHGNYNMLGAPTAIVEGQHQFIPDSIEKIRNATHYNQEVQDKAKHYFENDKKGRSIVSFPVASRHFKTSTSTAPHPRSYYGTVNLYRNEKNMFSGDNKNFAFFSDFTRPLNLITGRIAYMHMSTLLQLYSLKNPNDQ